MEPSFNGTLLSTIMIQNGTRSAALSIFVVSLLVQYHLCWGVFSRAIEQTVLQGSIHTKAGGLSGGLKRRLKLALELLVDRQILFLGASRRAVSMGLLEFLLLQPKICFPHVARISLYRTPLPHRARSSPRVVQEKTTESRPEKNPCALVHTNVRLALHTNDYPVFGNSFRRYIWFRVLPSPCTSILHFLRYSA